MFEWIDVGFGVSLSYFKMYYIVDSASAKKPLLVKHSNVAKDNNLFQN